MLYDNFNPNESIVKKIPSKTFNFKGNPCKEIEKLRQSHLLGFSNVNDRGKFMLLVIGRSMDPRCLEETKIPTYYAFDAKNFECHRDKDILNQDPHVQLSIMG